MKFFSIFILCIFSLTAVAEDAADSAEYQIKLEPEKKQVEVRRVNPPPGNPPQLRLKLFRKEKKPLEIKLHAIEMKQSPQRFIGRSEEWNGSQMGLELQFSFDGKSWKRLMHKLIP
jgi:hypothetical protein